MGLVVELDPRRVRMGRMGTREGGMMAGGIRGIRRPFRVGGGRRMMHGMGGLHLMAGAEGVIGRLGRYKNSKRVVGVGGVGGVAWVISCMLTKLGIFRIERERERDDESADHTYVYGFRLCFNADMYNTAFWLLVSYLLYLRWRLSRLVINLHIQ